MTTDNIKQQIIIEARSWIGTPWAHNQRLKGVGVDCVQFLCAIAEKFNIKYGDFPENYSRAIWNNNLENYLLKYFSLKEDEDIGDTDILLFRFGGVPHHVAIAAHLNGNVSMIHASNIQGKVVEHELDNKWKNRLINVFTWSLKDG